MRAIWPEASRGGWPGAERGLGVNLPTDDDGTACSNVGGTEEDPACAGADGDDEVDGDAADVAVAAVALREGGSAAAYDLSDIGCGAPSPCALLIGGTAARRRLRVGIDADSASLRLVTASVAGCWRRVGCGAVVGSRHAHASEECCPGPFNIRVLPAAGRVYDGPAGRSRR